MHSKKKGRTLVSRVLVAMLAIALVFTMMPLNSGSMSYAEGEGLEVQTPVLVVTGQGQIGGAEYSSLNVSAERSYSLDELKAISDVTGQLYSIRRSQDPFSSSAREPNNT